MYDEAWQKFREESHAFMRNKEETVIKKWLDMIGYTEPVGYYRNIFDKEMEIYATRVGCLIGKAGVNVREFEKMLSSEFIGEWHVKFVEIRGGFVKCENYTGIDSIEPTEIKVDAQCWSCGTPMGSQDNYCPNCGKKILK